MKIEKFAADLWRGPRPQTIEDMFQLKESGIRTVVNLESGWYERLHPLKTYRMWMEDCQIKVFKFQFSNWRPPTDGEMDCVLYLLQRYYAKPCYVHCLRGVDRTGYFVAGYKVKVLGWKPQDAIDDMLAHGFHKFPYEFWIEHLRRYCAKD